MAERKERGLAFSKTAVVVIRWMVWLTIIYSSYDYYGICSSDW
jgi:hypothetical protein